MPTGRLPSRTAPRTADRHRTGRLGPRRRSTPRPRVGTATRGPEADMRAVVWHGKRDVRVEKVFDPVIQDPGDAIIRVTSTNICGSDLHLYEVLGAVHERGRRPRPRADGHRRGGRRRRHRHLPRRPGRHPVPGLLRHLLDVRARPAEPVRDDPGARAGKRRSPVRLLRALRLGAGRPGRVPAGAPGAVHPRQGAPRARPTTGSSTCPTCCRPRGRRSRTPTPSRRAPSSCSAWARSATWRAASPCTAASAR